MFKFNLMFFLMICYNQSYSQIPSSDPLYDNVFVEEFSTNVLDQSKWYTSYEWGHFTNTNTVSPCGAWTDQLDVNSIAINPLDTHNRKIQNGILELITRKENNLGEIWTWPCGPPYNCFTPVNLPFKYSGSMVRTKKKFKYGYYEIKFKMPLVSGGNIFNYSYSPNFWMWAIDSSASYSELDVFEINGMNNKYATSIHVQRNYNIPMTNIGALAPNVNVTVDNWHIGGVKWTQDTLYYYYDGNIVYTISDSVKALTAMNLIVDNFAPALNYCIPLDSLNTPFPYNYKIDYVKVWQPKIACDTDKVYCNTNSNLFNSKYYKSLTIGGANCTAIFNSGKHSAVGVNYVLLNEGFEVNSNAEMLIDIKNCPAEKAYIGQKNEPPLPLSSYLYQNIINSRKKP